jgi:hypothetical protein
MVNICDQEVLGRRLKEGELTIDIGNGYFDGVLVGEEEAINSLRSCDIANLVGERIVERAVREKLADGRAVRRIDGVPFLMIYKFTA